MSLIHSLLKLAKAISWFPISTHDIAYDKQKKENDLDIKSLIKKRREVY